MFSVHAFLCTMRELLWTLVQLCLMKVVSTFGSLNHTRLFNDTESKFYDVKCLCTPNAKRLYVIFMFANLALSSYIKRPSTN